MGHRVIAMGLHGIAVALLPAMALPWRCYINIKTNGTDMACATARHKGARSLAPVVALADIINYHALQWH